MQAYRDVLAEERHGERGGHPLRRAAGVLLWALLVGCNHPPLETLADAGDGAVHPTNALASAAATGDTSTEASPADAGDSAPLGSKTFIARGIWGVHNTGNLRVRVERDRCVATYGAEGSYFCGSTHKLDCALGEEGRAAVVHERSCMIHCTPEGCPLQENAATCTQPCYAPSAGIHGTLRLTRSGALFFFLDAAVVENRKKWSGVDRLVAREDKK